MKKLAIIATILLTGCGGGPLTCNDSDAKRQVLAVVDSHLETARWYHDMKPALGKREMYGISTTQADHDLGRYSCSATYSFEYRGNTREVAFTYSLNYLEDKKESQVLVDVNRIKTGYMTAGMGF